MAFLTGTVKTTSHTFSFFGRVVRWLALLCVLTSSVPESHGDTVKDYDLKAVFLFNFAQFVDWPPEAFTNGESPIVIGILGEDPFGKSLDQVVRGEKVRDRKLVVRRFSRVEDIGACHILFISRSESERIVPILANLKGKPVLTVGEFEGFATSGGMVRFLIDQNKIRLRINKDAVNAAGLTMSSKLLKAAHEIVETKPP